MEGKNRTLGELAAELNGKLFGDPELHITGARGVTEAGSGDITFVADRKVKDAARQSAASCVLVSAFDDSLEKAQIEVTDPHLCFITLVEHFHPRPGLAAGIAPQASISPEAHLGERVTVGDFVSIARGARIGSGTVLYPGVRIGQDSSVGEHCIIYPNVTVMDGVTIGSNVIIHAGAVIGADGFGYIQREGRHVKVPQVGTVIIGDNVEIGANTTIDRATSGATVIEAGVKLDNLVHIAHNVHIGEGTVFAAQVGIAGSSTVGRGVMAGGQAGIADHVSIADGVALNGRTGVTRSIDTPGVYSGLPAMELRAWLKASSLFMRLPELFQRLLKIERTMQYTSASSDKEENQSND